MAHGARHTGRGSYVPHEDSTALGTAFVENVGEGGSI